MTESLPHPHRAPRQRRAVATRQRIYEAAMAEYGRVGLEAARVEDIVAAAGVSWGTFFHYFPTKYDVLLDATATVCRAFATATTSGMDAGQDTGMVLAEAFGVMFRTARQLTESGPLRGALLRQVVNRPGRLTAYLGDDVLPPVRATAEVMLEGQRRGEIQDDEPAEALAVIVLYAVLFSTLRDARLGRPTGSSPLNSLALQIVLRGMRPNQDSPSPVEPTDA